jgi:hypothetical protein
MLSSHIHLGLLSDLFRTSYYYYSVETLIERGILTSFPVSCDNECVVLMLRIFQALGAEDRYAVVKHVLSACD